MESLCAFATYTRSPAANTADGLLPPATPPPVGVPVGMCARIRGIRGSRTSTTETELDRVSCGSAGSGIPTLVTYTRCRSGDKASANGSRPTATDEINRFRLAVHDDQTPVRLVDRIEQSAFRIVGQGGAVTVFVTARVQIDDGLLAGNREGAGAGSAPNCPPMRTAWPARQTPALCSRSAIRRSLPGLPLRLFTASRCGSGTAPCPLPECLKRTAGGRHPR